MASLKYVSSLPRDSSKTFPLTRQISRCPASMKMKVAIWLDITELFPIA